MLKNRLLINASTFVSGGALQVGISLVQALFREKDDIFEFKIIVSNNLFEALPDEFKREEKIVHILKHPSNIISGYSERKKIKKIESEFMPDAVYSVSFPSYICFKSLEIARYTNPWQIYPEYIPWQILSFRTRLYAYLENRYKSAWASRAKYFETQNLSSKLNLMVKYGLKEDNFKVISNTPNIIFQNENKHEFKQKEYIFIFCLSAPYIHKNLLLIPKVANLFKEKYDLKFVVTIPSNLPLYDDFEKICKELKVSNMILNLGKISLSQCKEWYLKSSIVFVPTFLEVFSATFVEAMAMGVPIVASDRPFNRETCGNAALYFDPNSPDSAKECINKLISNLYLSQTLVNEGYKQLSKFPSVIEKHKILFDWLDKIMDENK
jgi:glycosyltransferase involved in cell wall biosynthesis